MGINACKVDMEIMTIMFADKVYAAYKTNCVFQCYSGPPGRLFGGRVFGELEIPEKSPLNFTGGETSFKFFTLLMQSAL